MREIVRICIAAVAVASTESALGSANPKLLAFVQTVIKQRALEAMLQAALPQLSVTAVGRVADFKRALAEGPDAVLTLPIVLQAFGITPLVRGHRASESEETYALVGVGAVPSPAQVGSVGALEMLDRSGTTALVHELVGRPVKVERVSKVEDLLPLLQLRRVDAVMAPQRIIAAIQGTSALTLAHRELSKRLGLPALASYGAHGAQAVSMAAKLAGKPAELMGVDTWR